MIQLSIKSWPEVRNHIKNGAKGYYILRDGWISVVLVDDLMECEFPTAVEFDALPPSERLLFVRKWGEEFTESYVDKLLKSTLSTE